MISWGEIETGIILTKAVRRRAYTGGREWDGTVDGWLGEGGDGEGGGGGLRGKAFRWSICGGMLGTEWQPKCSRPVDIHRVNMPREDTDTETGGGRVDVKLKPNRVSNIFHVSRVLSDVSEDGRIHKILMKCWRTWRRGWMGCQKTWYR